MEEDSVDVPSSDPGDEELEVPEPAKNENGKDVYVCDSCGALFAYSYSLLAHKRHKCHAGKGEFKCDLCHKRFNFPSQLQRHMPTHTGEKPFQCHHCPKAFNESSNLKQHMLIHTDQKPFCCDFATCEKRFRSASNLKVHMRTHTKERPYICEYSGCGKRFVSAGDLKRHFRIHTKERPYVCQYCGKSFIQGPYLNIHIRSHTKEKPYTCSHCGKAFSRTSTLKIHLRLHTGEKGSEKASKPKIYKCSPCDKTFDTHNSLQMHNAVSHAKTEPIEYDQGPPRVSPLEHQMYSPYKDPYKDPYPPHPMMHHTLPPMTDNYSYMQSLMYDYSDREVPCGTLPNGQTVPLIGRNASIVRPRPKRAEGGGPTPLSPDFIPQRDKMGMLPPMLPPLSGPDFYPPSSMSMLSDLSGEKIPPLVPVPLPPPGQFNFLPPIAHLHDPLYPVCSMGMPMGMPHLTEDGHMSHLPHDMPHPHMPPGMMDMRQMPPIPPPAQPLGSVFKPYQHLDMGMGLASDEDEDVKPGLNDIFNVDPSDSISKSMI
ncbi:oocyte zinc finger protein XlCOF8.4-like isoform X6 [Bolinopsis microptera]|uniref:oocyte zinc finger protein XlCOF8.4-like isoform X6 n=1 Tax=Bolinopsis microptera TaxID=2820187 RepID=UPI0030791A6E